MPYLPAAMRRTFHYAYNTNAESDADDERSSNHSSCPSASSSFHDIPSLLALEPVSLPDSSSGDNSAHDADDEKSSSPPDSAEPEIETPPSPPADSSSSDKSTNDADDEKSSKPCDSDSEETGSEQRRANKKVALPLTLRKVAGVDKREEGYEGDCEDEACDDTNDEEPEGNGDEDEDDWDFVEIGEGGREVRRGSYRLGMMGFLRLCC
ncbi:MAG: hypothetical protein LQ350_000094 [Teloschistes chrysophthalmus]|nr:MAG: hypothetical protein LQ350_000094 [Niorma chrysophthalma]